MDVRLFRCKQHKGFTFLIVFLLMATVLSGITFFGTFPAKADTEPNDSFAQAESMALNSTKFGSVNTSDTEDYYYIEVFEPALIIINISTFLGNSTDPLSMFIYDSIEDFISSTEGITPGNSSELWLALNSSNHARGGKYYIVLESISGEVNYTLVVTKEDQNDGGSWGDAGDTQQGARMILTDNSPATGWVHEDLDPMDIYKFDAIAGVTIIINITVNYQSNPTDSIDIEVLRWGESNIWTAFDITPSNSKQLEYTLNSTVGGTFYIKVMGNAFYTLKVDLAAQNDAGLSGDAPEITPVSFTDVDTLHNGLVGDEDYQDIFMFMVTSGNLINITCQVGSITNDPLSFRILNRTFEEKLSYNYLYPHSILYLNFQTSSISGGFYYLLVMAESRNTYNFTITLTQQNDADTGSDAMDTMSSNLLPVNPTPISEGMYSGKFGGDDMYDIYGMPMYLGQTIWVNVTPNPNIAVNLYLYDNITGPITMGLDSSQFTETGEAANVTWEATYHTFVYIWIEFTVYNDPMLNKSYQFEISMESKPVDETPPEIFNVTVSPTSYYVMITWETDEPTNGTVYYGLDETYGYLEKDYNTISIPDRMHMVYIYDIEAGNTYHYKIASWNEVGLINETLDGTFRIPRSIFIDSQYNALRTIVYGEVAENRLNSNVDLTIYCYDKGVPITPDSIKVTSATADDEITVKATSRAVGVYTGTYRISQADFDAEMVAIFVDITYQGDNDTVVFTSWLGDSEEEENWDVEIDYLSLADQNAGGGDTVNLQIIVTKNDQRADPESLDVTVVDYSEQFRANRVTQLTHKKTGIGEYTVSHTLPEVIDNSYILDFEAEIADGMNYGWDLLEHHVDIFRIWYHQLSLTGTSAEYDVYVTDMDNIPIASADIEITLSYEGPDYEIKESDQSGQTDASGKANFKFSYPDIQYNNFEILGSATLNNKTQYFDSDINLPSTEPEPYGDNLEVFPTSTSMGNENTAFFATKDDLGNVQRDYIAYSNSTVLKNIKIFYYVVHGMYSIYGAPITGTGNPTVEKTGNVDTDDNGIFSIDFKPSSTRAITDQYYSVIFESALGPFMEYHYGYRANGYDPVTSRDGLFYAEATDYFLVTDSPFSLTLEDIISGDIKITIPTLNKGSGTDISVSYSGAIKNPIVTVNFAPGTISVDTQVMDFTPTWGVFTEEYQIYLTNTEGKYVGQFTIPSFMTENTFTIMVTFIDSSMINLEYILTSFKGSTQINMVTLNVGEGVTDGGYEGGTTPPVGKLDSDGDKYPDDMEDRFGTDKGDAKSFPGSAIGEVFKEITFEDVKIAVSVETEGNVTVRSKLKESVPTIPENVGKDFGFFLEITSDENVTNVYIEIFLGLGNDSIVPAAVDPKTIKLFYYDEETDTWVEIIDSTYDEKTGILSATIDHLTVFSPMSKKGGGGSTPGEEEGAGLENMMIYLVLIMVIIVILSIVGIVVKKRGKSREPEMDEVDSRADEQPDLDVDMPEERPPDMEPADIAKDVAPPTTPISAPAAGVEPDSFGPEPVPEPVPEPPAQIEPVPATEPEPTAAQEPAQSAPAEPTAPTTTSEAPQQDIAPPAYTEPGPGAEPQTIAQAPANEPIPPTAPLTVTPTPEVPAPPAQTQPVTEPTTETQTQMIPCPTCQNLIAAYTTPCPHCNTNLNW